MENKLFSERLENFHLLDVGRYFKRPSWPNGEGIDLSLGQPPFETPQRIRDIASREVREGYGGYVSAYGEDVFREAVVKHLRDRHGLEYRMDQIIPSIGSSQALFILMRVLISPGDEVIIMDPYFPGYEACAQLVGASLKIVQTGPSYIPDPQAIEKQITPKTKLIIVNSPNNPTGAVYPKEVVEGIARLAEKYSLYILSDEVYSDVVYDGKEAVTFAGLAERIVVLQSFSKSHAMTGWRVGYAYGPSDVIRMMAIVSQYLYACVPPFLQKAAARALDLDTSYTLPSLQKKRDILYEGLKDHYDVTKPAGAYYMMLKTLGAEEEFVARLLEQKLIVFPGCIFSQRRGWVRLSFVAGEEKLHQAVNILQTLSEK